MSTEDGRDLVDSLMEGRISRREFVRRAFAAGLSMGAVGAVLQACGQSVSKGAPTAGAGSSPMSSAPAAGATTSAPAAGSPASMAGQATAAATVAPAQAGATTITLWHGWTGADNTEMLNTVLSKFNSEHKDIGIKPTALDWDALFSKWVVSFAAGNPPDVTMYHTSEVPEFAQRGITLPIDDMVQSAGIKFDGVPEPVLKAAHWEDKLHAVPGDLHPLGLYFNTDLAQKAGLDPNKPPKAKDDFLNWADKLTVRDSGGKLTQQGVYLPSTGAIPRWLWFSLLYQNGGTFLDAKGKAAVDSPESRDALQFVVDLYYKYKVASPGTTGGAGADPVAAKQVGMWFVGPWDVNQRIRQKLSFGTASLPVIGKQPAAWANAHCQSISKQRSDKNYKADMEFMKWFYDNYALPAKVVGVIPVNPAANKSTEFTQDERYKYYKAFIDELPHTVLEPSIPQYTRLFSFAKPTPLSTNLEAAIARKKPVEQALKDMKAGIDQILSSPL
jgi:multiple sugar transport system substrate-binding protein